MSEINYTTDETPSGAKVFVQVKREIDHNRIINTTAHVSVMGNSHGATIRLVSHSASVDQAHDEIVALIGKLELARRALESMSDTLLEFDGGGPADRKKTKPAPKPPREATREEIIADREKRMRNGDFPPGTPYSVRVRAIDPAQMSAKARTRMHELIDAAEAGKPIPEDPSDGLWTGAHTNREIIADH